MEPDYKEVEKPDDSNAPAVDEAIESEPEAAETQAGTSWLREVVETLLLAAIIFGFVNLTTGRFVVEGPSMEPNFETGEFILVSKVAYWFNEPQRGDIVVFHPPVKPDEEWIKRIVGLPGDMIEAQDGLLYVNGVLLDESYGHIQMERRGTWVVEEGRYFVMGDNRPNSEDSRSWGSLEPDLIIGKAWVIYWPLDKIGVPPHQDYADNQFQAQPDALAAPAKPTATFTVIPLPTLTPSGAFVSPTPGPADTATPTPPPTPTGAPVIVQNDDGNWLGASVMVNGTQGSGLAVREGPGADFGAIEVVADGTVFTVIAGPSDDGEIIWWRVSSESGLEGWAAGTFLVRVEFQ